MPTDDTVCGVPFAACSVCGARWPANVLDNFGRCATCGLDDRQPLPDGYTRDRHGFPVGPCRRCGGSGEFSYNPVHGTMCYGCQGRGKQYMVPKHHAAWREAVRAAVRVVTQDLVPGDVVRRWGDRDNEGRPTPGRTVVAVRRTDEPCAWSTGSRPDLRDVPLSQLPPEVVTGWYTLVTWDEPDAEPRRENGMQLWHREGVRIDPAPYVARAERGLRYMLERRSR